MDDSVILAKSHSVDGDVTLARHTRAVLQAFSALFADAAHPSTLALRWLRFFGLQPEDASDFFVNGWLAAALHDIGKANDGFQAAVRTQARQAVRHEHLSVLLLWEPSSLEWLRAQANKGVDPEIVAAAVASHHLKVSGERFAARLFDADRIAVTVYGGSADIAEVLAMASAGIGVPSPSLDLAAGSWQFDRDIEPRRLRFRRDMWAFSRVLAQDEHRRRLLLAVKAAVIVADSAGSAVTREGLDLTTWIHTALVHMPLTTDDIQQNVIQPRIHELEVAGHWYGFHDFQLAAATLGPRALLLSGCGSGKTLAAWKWVAAQLHNRAASRVLFLYPTRATATEGFRDYVAWAGPEDAALLSGTANYDLEGIFPNPDDPRAGDYTVPERMFALGYWDRRVFSATVDSFLALMANQYAALCMMPILADSIVVIDEVHSFSRSMFKALERFLTFFDVPVLCMTASLPDDRVTVLRDTCRLEVFPAAADQFADLERQAAAPRYAVQYLARDEVDSVAGDALAEGKRVLWVVNTVARCQEIARQLRDGLSDQRTVLCYHSRFRLMDRKRRHEEVIARFRGSHERLLLVTTQVCEMSLDLDADVLISEIAPVPSLIQRMGRCCRVPLPSLGRVGWVYMYAAPAPRPYTAEELREGELFARYLAGLPSASQAQLAEYLATMEVADPYAEGGFAGFIDSGWYAMSSDDAFRESEDYTVDAVLDTDCAAYLRLRRARSPEAAGYILPVPKRLSRDDSALGRFLKVAPADRYGQAFGFLEDRANV